MEPELKKYTMKNLGENIKASLSQWKFIIFLQSLIHWLFFYDYLNSFKVGGMMEETNLHFSMGPVYLLSAIALFILNVLTVISGVIVKIFFQLILRNLSFLLLFFNKIWAFKFPFLCANILISATLACLINLSEESVYQMFDPRDASKWFSGYIIIFPIIILFCIFVETMACILSYVLLKFCRCASKTVRLSFPHRRK